MNGRLLQKMLRKDPGPKGVLRRAREQARVSPGQRCSDSLDASTMMDGSGGTYGIARRRIREAQYAWVAMCGTVCMCDAVMAW